MMTWASKALLCKLQPSTCIWQTWPNGKLEAFIKYTGLSLDYEDEEPLTKDAFKSWLGASRGNLCGNA